MIVLGEELLTGEKSAKEIFIEACKNHAESDGVRSFAVTCRLALMLPDEIFTLTDIEFGISRVSYGEKSEMVEAIEKSRKNKNKFPNKSRRPRTLSGFMNIVCLSQAMVEVANGWKLGDISAAAEIADAATIEYKPYSFGIPLPLIASDAGATQNIPEKKFKEIIEGKRGLTPFNLSSINISDPIKTALLLEKANSAHESLVELCAKIIRNSSLTAVEDANSFDIAILEKNIIIEIKSIHRANAISQMRKAVAQLPEYVWRHRKFFATGTKKFY